MNPFFRDYCWRQGRPRGLQPYAAAAAPAGTSYKVISDPYYKHISVEQYQDAVFVTTLYDSAFFDFRTLKQDFPASWERDTTATATVVRDICDRVLWIERFTFSADVCRRCSVYSPHGLLLSTHQLFYTALGDTFDGVILFDATARIVLYKRYRSEGVTFTELVEESWEVPLDFNAAAVLDSR